ncbi:hypothetical protein NYE67_08270 [Solibacillus sp. FSL W8-0474]|uniref:hypothetical protein n=1 Tax=Solibacillus sp. FSL W8-0474 TaxID=2975336 RepID=UPI0030FAC90C
MEVNKRRKIIGKGKIIIILSVLLFIFLYYYYVSIIYFGTIEIRELKQDNNDFVVVVEGDFGVKEAILNEKDSFNIIENEQRREGNIAEIWNDLSEEDYFMRIKVYKNRNGFTLEEIYLD